MVDDPGPSARVGCIGECMVELCERPDGTLSRGFGGDTLNTAIYLARLGVAVDYVTALGDDPFSEDMLAAWRSEGVGTGLVSRVAGGLPGLYIIQTDDAGERRFSYWRDSSPARRLFSLPGHERIAEALREYDLVYLSGITLSLYNAVELERLWPILDAARGRGARIAFDTNFRPRGWPDRERGGETYRAMLARTDIVLAGLDDLRGLFGFDEEAAWVFLGAAGPGEVALKLPSLHCRVALGEQDWRVAAEPAAEVVDTTAAGDSFAAAYLAARLAGAPPDAAARAGHRLAGQVVRHRGAIIPRAMARAG